MPGDGLVVTRCPLAIRLGVLIACGLLAFGIVRGPVSTWTLLVAVGALCLTVSILSYKAEVDRREVRVRHLPFYTSHTPLLEITHLVEERTLVLVAGTTKIPLWGLSATAREELFRILPGDLKLMPAHADRPTDNAAAVRRFARYTTIVAGAFLVNLALSIPFLHGNRWNRYIDAIGKYALLVCLCTFLLLLFLGGFTIILWDAKRAADKIETRRGARSH